MSEGSQTTNCSVPSPRRRQPDVISAGLDTGTSDFETLRRRLMPPRHRFTPRSPSPGELAGLMESDLSDAAKAGEIRPNRPARYPRPPEALATGVKAAADGEEEPRTWVAASPSYFAPFLLRRAQGRTWRAP